MCRPNLPGPNVPPDPPVDLLALWSWVGRIAVGVAARYNLWASAVDDLTSAGYVRALGKLPSFRPTTAHAKENPDRAFRAWVAREIRTEIQREAARILGGGTFHAPRREPGKPLVIAKPISDFERDRPGEREEPLGADNVAEGFRELPRTADGDDDCWWEGMLEPHHHLQKPFDLSAFHDDE